MRTSISNIANLVQKGNEFQKVISDFSVNLDSIDITTTNDNVGSVPLNDSFWNNSILYNNVQDKVCRRMALDLRLFPEKRTFMGSRLTKKPKQHKK